VHFGLEERLKKIFAEIFQLSPEQVTDESSPKTVPRWDSMNSMVLTMALEEEFNIQFTDQELVKMYDFGKIRDAVTLKTTGKTIG